MYEDTRTGAADLAVVEAVMLSTMRGWGREEGRDVLDPISTPLNSRLEIHIIINDRRTLPSQLKRNMLEITISSSPHDLPTRSSAPSKRNFINIHMGGDSVSDRWTVAYE